MPRAGEGAKKAVQEIWAILDSRTIRVLFLRCFAMEQKKQLDVRLKKGMS